MSQPTKMVIGDLLNIDMLKQALEKPFDAFLWAQPLGKMTPYVCNCSFGDGLQLVAIATINQRPNYHIVRVDSSWDCGRHEQTGGTYFGEYADEVTFSIEEECGQRTWDDWCDICSKDPCECDPAPWPAADFSIGFSWCALNYSEIFKGLSQEQPA